MIEQLNIVEIEEQAVNAFNHIYKLQTPPPVEPDIKRSISAESKIMIGALFSIMLASVIVSAAHTIPIFTGTVHFTGFWDAAKYLVGIGTLIMVEIAMIALAYFAIKVNPRAVSSREIKAKAYLAIGVAITIAISANVYSVMENFYYSQNNATQEQITPVVQDVRNVSLNASVDSQNSSKTRSIAKLIIAILIGLCAPIQALIAGDILGVQLVMEQKKLDDYKASYQRDYQAWLVRRDDKWQQVKGSYITKVKRELSLNAPDVRYLSGNLSVNNEQADATHDNGLPANTNAGINRNRNAKQLAYNFFMQFPEKRELSLNALEVEISAWANQPVKRTSIGEVRKALENQKGEE